MLSNSHVITKTIVKSTLIDGQTIKNVKTKRNLIFKKLLVYLVYKLFSSMIWNTLKGNKMLNLRNIIFLTSASILVMSSAVAQTTAVSNSSADELNKLLAQSASATPVVAPVAITNNPTITTTTTTTTTSTPVHVANGKPLNTPAATSGADYGGNIVTGLDDYNNRKKMIAERAAEIQRNIEEEYRRKSYEQALRAAQEREKQRIVESSKNNGAKKMSNQDYFDRQTKAMQGTK